VIKAVCFDLYNTLARFQPPREEVYASACGELGIEVEPKALAESLPEADAFWREENLRSPVEKRPEKGKTAVYVEYVIRALEGAGVKISREKVLQMLMKVQKVGFKFELYDDSLPALKVLKERKLILGLISNVGMDIVSMCKDLGLESYLDFRITSFEVGCDKPQPGIFLAALKEAQVKPEEALYVGDQYDLDVVGARGVGIKAVLLDRNDSFTNIGDCPRIRSLAEIVEYL